MTSLDGTTAENGARWPTLPVRRWSWVLAYGVPDAGGNSYRALAGAGAASARYGGRPEAVWNRDPDSTFSVSDCAVMPRFWWRGSKESASFSATIVIVKVGVVLFVILLGMHYVNPANWGTRLVFFRAYGNKRNRSRGARTYFFRLSPDSTRFRLRRRRLKITPGGGGGPARSAHRHLRFADSCARFYTCWLQRFLPGMVPWKGSEYRRAPLPVAFPRSRVDQGFLLDHRRGAGPA